MDLNARVDAHKFQANRAMSTSDTLDQNPTSGYQRPTSSPEELTDNRASNGQSSQNQLTEQTGINLEALTGDDDDAFKEAVDRLGDLLGRLEPETLSNIELANYDIRCSGCFKTSEEANTHLHSCPWCGLVYYCSVECRLSDDPDHRVFCDQSTSKGQRPFDPNWAFKNKCFKCQTHKSELEHPLLVCSRCKWASYCSPKCQYKAADDHHPWCRDTAACARCRKQRRPPLTESPDGPPFNAKTTAQLTTPTEAASNADKNLFRANPSFTDHWCEQCNEIWYCSTKCQNADLREHRTFCDPDKAEMIRKAVDRYEKPIWDERIRSWGMDPDEMRRGIPEEPRGAGPTSGPRNYANVDVKAATKPKIDGTATAGDTRYVDGRDDGPAKTFQEVTAYEQSLMKSYFPNGQDNLDVRSFLQGAGPMCREYFARLRQPMMCYGAVSAQNYFSPMVKGQATLDAYIAQACDTPHIRAILDSYGVLESTPSAAGAQNSSQSATQACEPRVVGGGAASSIPAVIGGDEKRVRKHARVRNRTRTQDLKS